METKKKTIYNKLLEIQTELGAIEKTKENPFFHSQYADINDYLKAIKPVLNKKGIVILQPLHENSLRTILVDTETNERIETEVNLPENPDPQKMGSIITYFRRFAIQSLFALQAEDDDANKGADNKEVSKAPMAPKQIRDPQSPATEAQQKMIYRLLDKLGMDRDAFEKSIKKGVGDLKKGEASNIIERGIASDRRVAQGEIPIIEE